MSKPTRPVCRYYGGKWKIAEWIISFFPEHRCYVEPFGGAASVLMRKKPARVEVYNDLSKEIVNMFRILRNPVQSEELRRLLDLTPYSRAEWLDCYEKSEDQVEQARRTIVLATMSHNPSKVLMRQSNGFRSSSSGYHLLPQDFRNHTKALEAVTGRLKDVIIECRPAIEVMRQHDSPNTLHYVDPPYLGDLRADKKNTYQHELFTRESHESLAEFLHGLKGYVVLSGYQCDEYEQWYEGWQPFSMQAVTGAAVPGKSRRMEVIWLNPKAADAQRQLSIFHQLAADKCPGEGTGCYMCEC